MKTLQVSDYNPWYINRTYMKSLWRINHRQKSYRNDKDSVYRSIREFMMKADIPFEKLFTRTMKMSLAKISKEIMRRKCYSELIDVNSEESK